MTAFISIIAQNKPDISAVTSLLEREGYRTNCFTGKNAAIAFLKNPPESIDLLLLDYELAEKDGFQLLKQLIETGIPAAIPILFMAKAGDSQEIPREYLQPGSYDFIDPESDLPYLNSRVSILLELQKLRIRHIEPATEEATHDKGSKHQNNYFAGLSHDLRNPIHGILSYAKFGIKKTQSDELTREKSLHYYHSILDAGMRLLDLLNDILELTKLNAGKISFDICERNLGTVVKGVMSKLYKEVTDNHLPLTLIEPEDPVLADFDVKQIGYVVHRLLSGFDQTAENTKQTTLKIESVDSSANDRTALDCPAIRFTLHHPEADFSKERQEALQHLCNDDSNNESTLGQMGLNISICQRIIARHNGRLWIESHPDGGTIFGFVLPVRQRDEE